MKNFLKTNKIDEDTHSQFSLKSYVPKVKLLPQNKEKSYAVL